MYVYQDHTTNRRPSYGESIQRLFPNVAPNQRGTLIFTVKFWLTLIKLRLTSQFIITTNSYHQIMMPAKIALRVLKMCITSLECFDICPEWITLHYLHNLKINCLISKYEYVVSLEFIFCKSSSLLFANIRGLWVVWFRIAQKRRLQIIVLIGSLGDLVENGFILPHYYWKPV